MKQTAVEYLIKEFSDILGKIQTETFQDLLMVYAMKKAKEIEKQQIIDAWGESRSGLEYYNRTYNK